MIRILLQSLSDQGCFPCISKRGKRLWRAHVNSAGNYWHDDTTPLKALRGAVRLWVKAGKPMDGMAAIAAAEARGK